MKANARHTHSIGNLAGLYGTISTSRLKLCGHVPFIDVDHLYSVFIGGRLSASAQSMRIDVEPTIRLKQHQDTPPDRDHCVDREA